MRWVAHVPDPESEIRRLILYDAPKAVYLFMSERDADEGASGDQWFASVDDARAVAEEQFGVSEADWKQVPDPEPGCQHDWIRPVRIAVDADGKKRWGVLEIREGGAWRTLGQPG